MPVRKSTKAVKAPAKKVARKPAAGKTKKASGKKDITAVYNQFKTFGGRQYTGMAVGRTHTWNYDQGLWKEKKITPDRWEISYAVTKRRRGHAPEGSGVPVGTQYHWYILSHQYATKRNANDYDTQMQGFKFKIAHKRADHEKWNISEATQHKHLIKVLEDFIKELKKGSVAPPEKDKEPGKAKRAGKGVKRAGRKQATNTKSQNR